MKINSFWWNEAVCILAYSALGNFLCQLMHGKISDCKIVFLFLFFFLYLYRYCAWVYGWWNKIRSIQQFLPLLDDRQILWPILCRFNLHAVARAGQHRSSTRLERRDADDWTLEREAADSITRPPRCDTPSELLLLLLLTLFDTDVLIDPCRADQRSTSIPL